MSKRGAMMAAVRQQSAGGAASLTVAALGVQAYWDMADNSASGMTMGTGSNIETFIDKSGNGRNITQASTSLQSTWDATEGATSIGQLTQIGVTASSLTFDAVVYVTQYKDGVTATTFDKYAAFFTTSGSPNRAIGVPGTASMHTSSSAYWSHINGGDQTTTVLPLKKSLIRIKSNVTIASVVRPLWHLAETDRGLHGFTWAVVIPPLASSDTFYEKLAGILAHKYGIASKLPPAHPYKSAPPTS